MEIPLENLAAPLSLSLFLSEGDLLIRGKDCSQITIEFDDSDEEDVGHFTVDTETGIAQIQLRGEQLDSDLILTLPTNTSLRIRTSEGDVDIYGIDGDIEVTASDGSICLIDIAGSVSASSSDGDIRLQLRDASDLKNITLSSSDGDIDLLLPPIKAFSLIARTVDGDVVCSYPFRSSGSSVKEKRPRLKDILFSDTLSFQHNEGGFPILLSTSDGDIEISQN